MLHTPIIAEKVMSSLLKKIPFVIYDHFDPQTITRGFDYESDGHVKKLSVFENGRKIYATVQGSGKSDYNVAVYIEPNDDPEAYKINSTCSCPVGTHCKHAVAALVQAVEREEKLLSSKIENHQSKIETVNEEEKRVHHWLNTLQHHTLQSAIAPQSLDHVLQYILYIAPYRKTNLCVNLKLARVLKKGGFGQPKNFDPNSYSQHKYLTEIDEENLTYLKIMNHGSTLSAINTIQIKEKNSSQYLESIIKSGRCYFNNNQIAVSLGQPKKAVIAWELLPNSNQKIHCKIDDQILPVFILDALWYYDQNTNTIGIAETEIPLALIDQLLAAPEVTAELVPTVTKQLQVFLPNTVNLKPINVPKAILLSNIIPKPIIILSIDSITVNDYRFGKTAQEEIPVAQILFEYNNDITIPFSFGNTNKIVKFLKENKPYQLERNFDSEKKYLLELGEIIQLTDFPKKTTANEAEKFIIEELYQSDDYINFITLVIPRLELYGWKVISQHENFHSVIYEEDISWYSELEESAGFDYFGLKLGIIIENEKIDILPTIAQFLKNTPHDQVKNCPDSQKIAIPLPNGKVLSTTFSRIKPIVNTLVELFDSEVNLKSNIRFSKYQSELLHELEKGFGATQIRWFGGEKLRALGKKIAEFQKINPIKCPKIFKAALRPYQQEGLNWLQFLREYQLNGILADDMGLGKTVQTIAHLSVEKTAKRITKPILIIAPTSLMFNWQREIQKFCPALKILVFHGDDRKIHEGALSEYDIVLTTYPLLVRDKAILLKELFYYLILDEAQNIKNNQTKSTQIVHQLQADHRICLTGTPMENHLGDLWSLFHFLMPGLLGDVKQFNRVFRKPIEKEKNTDRQVALSQRLKPFMLRRKKSDVALDLPDKTEIIRTAELEGPERDLYESIRLTMEKKVRDALKKQGLNRSHIIILDALLKLRQVCCHPSLVKLKTTGKAYKHGSKLKMLQEMLPSMIEEGRKILIFSQFTEMLELIESMIIEEKYTYVKLTGSTKDRATPIAAFQDTGVSIFLISLKAGGVGLNLTAADTVIHYDPWWNPAVEDQATDRAHRIGQKKSVFVYKLLTAGTVEETIQEMQQKKRQLIEGLFSESPNSKSALSAEDLQNLFKPLTLA